MKHLSSLSVIINRYDAFVLDLWGVVHDGIALYPDVLPTLQRLKSAGKRALFLSNGPRRASAAVAKLEELGVNDSLYERVITSGEVAFSYLARADNQRKWGENCYYIGLEKDKKLLAELSPPYIRQDDINRADFVLCSGYESFTQRPEALLSRLKLMHKRKLLMLCINPDIEVVRQNGERILCAGHLAGTYEEMGGEVTYIGKPYPLVYESCMEHFSAIPRERILAVGDSLATDIAGANAAGIDSILITGGILKSALGENPCRKDLERICHRQGAYPYYVLPAFLW